mmetsp:Transcript_35652/g.113999  ORF Transcript_35652/g.113999 Transcript_35652/m.113999 type:complete len:84 (-) Transcript_35652:554-805(-)
MLARRVCVRREKERKTRKRKNFGSNVRLQGTNGTYLSSSWNVLGSTASTLISISSSLALLSMASGHLSSSFSTRAPSSSGFIL